MLRFWKCVVFQVGILVFFGSFMCRADVTVSAEKMIVKVYREWSAQVPCERIKTYGFPDAPRGAVELMLACRALRLGGYPGSITVRAYPNYERALIEAKAGRVTMTAETLWEMDIDEDYLLATAPIIRDGEFTAGLYTTPDRADVLAVRSLEELREFRTALPKIWRVGWKTLQAMGLREVVDVPGRDSMFQVLKAGRVDFILMEFSDEPDFSIKYEGLKLIPIPKIKYGLKGIRRFVVSKAAPDAKAIFEAMEGGIRRLRELGEIERAFRESGFHNERVAEWTKIN